MTGIGCLFIDVVNKNNYQNNFRPFYQKEQILSLKTVAEQNPHFLTLSGGINNPIKREMNKFALYETIQVGNVLLYKLIKNSNKLKVNFFRCNFGLFLSYRKNNQMKITKKSKKIFKCNN